MYMGSADWMYRNLNNRIEVIAPVDDREQREDILKTLEYMLQDKVQGWDLQPDGNYTSRKADKDEIGSHDYLINLNKGI